VMTQGIAHINKQLPAILEEAANDLPDTLRALLRRLGDNLQEMDRHVKEIDREIGQWHQHHTPSRKLAALRGVGPITASAVVATVGNARNFDNGRSFSAFLGLVPRQQSSGGKSVLLGISKRGDVYLRTLLIHGARSVVRHVNGKTDKTSLWLQALIARSNINVAVVALANKNARIIWAMLAKDCLFDENYVSIPTAA
jgi:transposase